jgi:hypothetical protein
MMMKECWMVPELEKQLVEVAEMECLELEVGATLVVAWELLQYRVKKSKRLCTSNLSKLVMYSHQCIVVYSLYTPERAFLGTVGRSFLMLISSTPCKSPKIDQNA